MQPLQHLQGTSMDDGSGYVADSLISLPNVLLTNLLPA